jgi:hypothetical protein
MNASSKTLLGLATGVVLAFTLWSCGSNSDEVHSTVRPQAAATAHHAEAPQAHLTRAQKQRLGVMLRRARPVEGAVSRDLRVTQMGLLPIYEAARRGQLEGAALIGINRVLSSLRHALAHARRSPVTAGLAPELRVLEKRLAIVRRHPRGRVSREEIISVEQTVSALQQRVTGIRAIR